jgi:hypothetical protein
VVTAIEVLEHVPDDGVAGFLQTLAARARPGGTVLVCVPTKVVPLNRKHYRHYDAPLIAEQLAASGAPLEIERIDYVYRTSRLARLVSRATNNRIFSVEVPALQRLLWRHTWTRLRSAEARDGQHLIATLRARG